MEFVIVNKEEIKDLPSGTYNTKVIEANWDEIKIEFLNTPYNQKDPQCLFPLTIH